MAISRRYGCSVAATVLQWNLQRGVTVIPATLKRAELEENLSLMPTLGAAESKNALGRSESARSHLLICRVGSRRWQQVAGTKCRPQVWQSPTRTC